MESSIIHDANQAAIPAVGFVWSDFNMDRQRVQPAQFEIGFVRSIFHDTLRPAHSAQFEIGFVRQDCGYLTLSRDLGVDSRRTPTAAPLVRGRSRIHILSALARQNLHKSSWILGVSRCGPATRRARDHGRQTVVRTGNLQPRTSVRSAYFRIGLTPEVRGQSPRPIHALTCMVTNSRFSVQRDTSRSRNSPAFRITRTTSSYGIPQRRDP